MRDVNVDTFLEYVRTSNVQAIEGALQLSSYDVNTQDNVSQVGYHTIFYWILEPVTDFILSSWIKTPAIQYCNLCIPTGCRRQLPYIELEFVIWHFLWYVLFVQQPEH